MTDMHRHVVTALLATGVIVCAGCGTRTEAARTRSGVNGIVQAGPTCPVERPESPCPDRPVSDATVTAKHGRVTRRTTSGPDGSFSLKLAHGAYDVTATSRSVFGCDTTRVRVTKNSYATATITCDTGIR